MAYQFLATVVDARRGYVWANDKGETQFVSGKGDAQEPKRRLRKLFDGKRAYGRLVVTNDPKGPKGPILTLVYLVSRKDRFLEKNGSAARGVGRLCPPCPPRGS